MARRAARRHGIDLCPVEAGREAFFSTDNDVQTRVEDRLARRDVCAAQVFYDPTRLTPSMAKRTVANVGSWATMTDSIVETLAGDRLENPDEAALVAHGLLSDDDRIRSRGRVLVVHDAPVYAKGGYPPDNRNVRKLYRDELRATLVHFIAYDFAHPRLELMRTGILAKTPPPAGNSSIEIRPSRPSGESVFLNLDAFRRLAFRDVSFTLQCVRTIAMQRGQKAWLKFPPLGLGVYTKAWNGGTIGPVVLETFLHGMCDAILSLGDQYVGSFLHCLELPDFTTSESYSRAIMMRVVPFHRTYCIVCGRRNARDILDWDPTPTETPTYFRCVVMAGSSIAVPGNQKMDISIDSMIANNTSLRCDGAWPWNPQILEKSPIPVLPTPMAMPKLTIEPRSMTPMARPPPPSLSSMSYEAQS